nr:putative ribonuclease h protein [Quercus suber]
MANMEELHMAASAYYRNASNELRQRATEFFHSMDTNGDGGVSFNMFVQFFVQNGYNRVARNFFRSLDSNGDGFLDFFEVLTFYYILKTRGGNSCISLWNDKWLDKGSLRSLIAGPLNRGEEERLLKDVVSLNGWNEQDHITWSSFSSGNFELKEAYKLAKIAEEGGNAEVFKGEWIWKVLTIPKIKCFLWQCYHKSISMRTALAARGMDFSLLCPGIIFSFVLWSIWLHRNKIIFRIERAHKDLKEESMAKAFEFAFVGVNGKRTRSRTIIKVGWGPPPINWFKLHLDGSLLGNPGLEEGEGLIRDVNGNWVKGYARAIDIATSVATELWALRDGIRLCVALKLQAIIIELDAQIMVNFMNKDAANLNGFSAIVKGYVALLLGLDSAGVLFDHFVSIPVSAI